MGTRLPVLPTAERTLVSYNLRYGRALDDRAHGASGCYGAPVVFQYWHLAVIAALIALVVWGFRTSRRLTLFALAAVLLLISVFLLDTLVLDEEYLDSDLNGRLDSAALIGIPAVLGVVVGVLALKSKGTRA